MVVRLRLSIVSNIIFLTLVYIPIEIGKPCFFQEVLDSVSKSYILLCSSVLHNKWRSGKQTPLGVQSVSWFSGYLLFCWWKDVKLSNLDHKPICLQAQSFGLVFSMWRQLKLESSGVLMLSVFLDLFWFVLGWSLWG